MTRKPVIYIAGPMRGIKHFNFPAFDAAQQRLELLGFEVINPANLDREAGCDPLNLNVPEDFDWRTIPPAMMPPGNSLRDVFLRDTHAICTQVDVIYRLKGWERSSGANAEVALGRALGLMFLEDL